MKPQTQWTVAQVARQAGVTVRTLHHYDRIGLLRPEQKTAAGYRLYGKAELERLQEILFLRELDFPLGEIAAILDHPAHDRREALRRQRELLLLKRQRLDGLLALLARAVDGDPSPTFEEFSMDKINRAKAAYQEEARARWGDTEAYRESQRRTAAYTEADWASLTAEMEEIFAGFSRLLQAGEAPESPAAAALVARWQAFISEHYYPCSDEMLAGLGQMYAADPRFAQSMDKAGPGTAAYVARCIACRAN